MKNKPNLIIRCHICSLTDMRNREEIILLLKEIMGCKNIKILNEIASMKCMHKTFVEAAETNLFYLVELPKRMKGEKIKTTIRYNLPKKFFQDYVWEYLKSREQVILSDEYKIKCKGDFAYLFIDKILFASEIFGIVESVGHYIDPKLN